MEFFESGELVYLPRVGERFLGLDEEDTTVVDEHAAVKVA